MTENPSTTPLSEFNIGFFEPMTIESLVCFQKLVLHVKLWVMEFGYRYVCLFVHLYSIFTLNVLTGERGLFREWDEWNWVGAQASVTAAAAGRQQVAASWLTLASAAFHSVWQWYCTGLATESMLYLQGGPKSCTFCHTLYLWNRSR